MQENPPSEPQPSGRPDFEQPGGQRPAQPWPQQGQASGWQQPQGQAGGQQPGWTPPQQQQPSWQGQQPPWQGQQPTWQGQQQPSWQQPPQPSWQPPQSASPHPTPQRRPRARVVRRRGPFTPLVTYTLIALNALVWLALFATGGNSSPLVDAVTLNPLGRCSAGDRYWVAAGPEACPALGASWYPGMADGAWWQLLTSAFAHVSIMHIGFNMLALYFLGPSLEQFLGRARFTGLYLFSAIAGSTVVYWLSDPSSSTLGASGAVFGLMGALFVAAYKLGRPVNDILMWLGINVAVTIFGGAGISWQGHLGGLVGGLIAGWILVSAKKESTGWWALVGGTVALLALVGLRTAMLG